MKTAPYPLRKPDFIEQRKRERDMFVELILAKGRVIYESAIVPRYPGGACTKSEAQRALKTCKAFRKEARLSLGLSV